MEIYTHTDLASESVSGEESSLSGVLQSEREVGGFTVRRIRICSEGAAEKLGKPIGDYFTLDCGRADHMDADSRERLAHVLSGELRGLAERSCGKPANASLTVLIVGLGNIALTADAIGPLTIRRLTATAHLKTLEPELYRSLGCSAVFLLSPGVLGQSGMETGVLVRAVADRVFPDLIVAVDALAARDLERLAATIQLSDAGIAPGSGVGNRRWALTRESMGVPVLALGVPTVVGSSTLVYDALARAGITEPCEELQAVLENGRNFFVSLKESDEVTEHVCSILSRALSLAFLGGMEL